MNFCGWFIAKSTVSSFFSSFSGNFGDQNFKMQCISIAKYSALQCAGLAGIRHYMISHPTRKKYVLKVWQDEFVLISFICVHKNKQALPTCLFDLGIKLFQIDQMLKVQCVSMAGVGRRVISHPRRKKSNMKAWQDEFVLVSFFCGVLVHCQEGIFFLA